jgi:HEPN domain-containing protein
VSDSFAQAAGRHLEDAQILLEHQRWDNTIYLAGYVVECSFKVLVEVYIDDRDSARKYGHDLTKLQGQFIDRLRLMYPELDMQLPASRTTGTVLDQDHPQRRYYRSGRWSASNAESAIERAKEIYMDIIPRLILDGTLSSKEL